MGPMELNEALMLLILRYAEEHADGSRSLHEPSLNGYTRQQVRYHIEMCHQAGYLTVRRDGKRRKIVALTWNGHQHLKQNRDG